MDFFNINERSAKDGVVEVYPDWIVGRSKDLMVHSQKFYAIWDPNTGLWSVDEYDVQRLVDEKVVDYKKALEQSREGVVKAKLSGKFSSGVWVTFQSFLRNLSDSFHELDRDLTFANSSVDQSDYRSKRLPYSLDEGDISAWDEIISTLYDPEERAKIEWAIGAIVAGDSKTIQKFLVFYGPPGSGKGTILDIILKLFVGYTTTFNAKELTSNNGTFATDVFRDNPLVAVQHDGDMSKIEDNARFNSITSHEPMSMNRKFKDSITAKVLAMCLMGTNKPVKITDAKSGIIRRLIDVVPSGRKIPPRRYQALISQVDFELGAIASHCLAVYREMGKHYYETYRAIEMMLQTDVFYNYIEFYYDIFSNQNGTSLTQAYKLYKEFCEETGVEWVLPQYKFREELKNYFGKFDERADIKGVRVRSWYSDFLTDKFKIQIEPEKEVSLVIDEDESIFDKLAATWPAQYAKENGDPERVWTGETRRGMDGKDWTPRPDQVVNTTLADLDTGQLHFVKFPEEEQNHIVIDFDLVDDNGEKSLERNLEAASHWPPTYAELSKSGLGVHLHYIYDGDVEELSRVYDDNIEIKVYKGNSSLRRRFSKANNIPIAVISSGLPLKEKKVITKDFIVTEKSLREQVMRNLRKEIHPGTKSSVDMIAHILEEAYDSGVPYDLTDMRGGIMAFANNSTNQALAALKVVQKMKFKSQEAELVIDAGIVQEVKKEDRLAIFDVEVFPNLFVICWKFEDRPDSAFGHLRSAVVKMINPSAEAVEELLKLKLVGFNNRRYDNHIIYAASLGYSIEQLYILSKKIIENVPGAAFGAAYNLSYADIFDVSSIKESLKWFEIMLGLPHKELNIPFDREKYKSQWDAPVPKELWEAVAAYCANDVVATDDVLQDRRQDLVAREILAALSGLPVNSSSNSHSARIVFGSNRNPQKDFIYTELSEEFPGYTFDSGKSSYRGEDPGEGGYVYAEPGIYEDVALLDIVSMHPTTIEVLNMFGVHTAKFSEIKAARVAIKRKDYATAREMFNGKLAPFLKNEEDAEALSYALKIVINSVYGLTSAKFENPFRDLRNKDNIVAKRGALFMIELKLAVQALGYTVVHIKTDSIKIANADKYIIDFVMNFGDQYGYEFEHEATYEKLCLVNKAVYIAKSAPGRKPSKWVAVGAEFAHPYVFKTLFSKEPIEFRDKCEAKFVNTALYLDHRGEEDEAMALEEDKLHFVGKAGLFTPIKPGKGGALLRREDKEGKLHAANGSTGYEWLEADYVKDRGAEDDIDLGYFRKLVDAAVKQIAKFGDAEAFMSDDVKELERV